jgi:hypothetical protein
VNQPLEVTPRALVLIARALAALVTGVAIAATALTQPPEASAANSNAAVVKQLKSINSQMQKTNTTLTRIGKSVGYSDFGIFSLRKNTYDIAQSTESMCRELGGLSC